MQKWRNSSALAMDLRLFSIMSWIWSHQLKPENGQENSPYDWKSNHSQGFWPLLFFP